MKVTFGDAYDRSQFFNQQSDYVNKGCDECVRNRPPQYGSWPFYIFAHQRTIETDERIALFNQDTTNWILDPTSKRLWKTIDEVPSTRLIWSPRLTKPAAQTNSMLFRHDPRYPGDYVVIWVIPAKALWDQYKKGNLTENQTIVESIDNFVNRAHILEKPMEEDCPKNEAIRIMNDIRLEYIRKKGIKI